MNTIYALLNVILYFIKKAPAYNTIVYHKKKLKPTKVLLKSILASILAYYIGVGVYVYWHIWHIWLYNIFINHIIIRYGKKLHIKFYRWPHWSEL